MARLAVLLLLAAAGSATTDYSQYVNPLIGGSGPIPGLAFGGGDIFVGGALPFGVAKLGIDTYETNKSVSTLNGGWTPQGLVTGISMMHEHGTGGSPKYGVVPQMPLTTVDAPVNVLDNTTYWQKRVGNDTARVGYFKTKLENGISVEISASRHAGIYQYAFPKESQKHILVDLSHYLPDEQGSYSTQYFTGGELSLGPNGTYTGHGAPFTLYFCGDFDQAPVKAQTFHGRNTDPMPRQQTFSNGPVPTPTFGGSHVESGPLLDRIGALFTWNDTSSANIRSRVGISFISSQKACLFKNDELPTWKLNDTVQKAVSEWNSQVFSKIHVDTSPATSNKTNLILLYSSLYFMHLMPSDRTGENPLWQSSEPFWDDFYTMWDIFRCTVSLYHLLQPTYYESMIRGVIDIWRFSGYMPDGRSGNYNGLVQGGSNADNVLADAYVKGLRGGINWTDGYAAMVKDAEVVPYNTFSYDDPSASVKEGRGALQDWLELGYVSQDRNTRCVSRTVEYALNDFALAQVAHGEAPGDVPKYLNRSAGWQRSWNHNVSHKGFTGFMAPRLSDGSWNVSDYNPALCGACEWEAISYEGVPFEYSFTIPHDMVTLIDFMGGTDEFRRRLDYIFQPNTSEQNLGANGQGITTIMNIGNEPDFATPYLYHYLNEQATSVQRTRDLAHQFFKNDLYGVPGNSDAGALNSWLIWQMVGLYPIVTTPVYLLGSPWFNDVNITVNGNKTLRIRAHGLGEQSYFVQGVKLNGKQWRQNWFNHDEVMVHGGLIEFDLGPKPVAWATGSVPPSPGHVKL